MGSGHLVYLDRAKALMDSLQTTARSDGLVLRSRLSELMRRIGAWASNSPSPGEIASVDVELQALAVEVSKYVSGFGRP
jgi:hypothetical protein